MGSSLYFSEREQAIHYAASRTALRRGEIRILSTHGEIVETITFDESSDWGERHHRGCSSFPDRRAIVALIAR